MKHVEHTPVLRRFVEFGKDQAFHGQRHKAAQQHREICFARTGRQQEVDLNLAIRSRQLFEFTQCRLIQRAPSRRIDEDQVGRLSRPKHAGEVFAGQGHINGKTQDAAVYA